MPVAPVYATDCIPVASTQTVPALSMLLLSVHILHAATQLTATLAGPVYASSIPMHTMTACTHGPTAPVVPVCACAPTMPMHLVSGAAPTLPALAMPAVHEFTPGPAVSLYPIHDCVPAASRPAMPVCEYTPTLPTPAMHECMPARSLHPMPGPVVSMPDCTLAVPQPAWPVHAHTPRPTGPALRILCLHILCLLRLLLLCILSHSLSLHCQWLSLSLLPHLLFTLQPHLPQRLLNPRWC